MTDEKMTKHSRFLTSVLLIVAAVLTA